jgi:hypothetical protein
MVSVRKIVTEVLSGPTLMPHARVHSGMSVASRVPTTTETPVWSNSSMGGGIMTVRPLASVSNN